MTKMSKYKTIQPEMDACQWFKNGDHPNDNSGHNDKEGAVVRRFRHPDVRGDAICSHCDRPANEHGWIDTLDGGRSVCPGDWVITGPTGEYQVCRAKDFPRLFEKVK